MSLNVWSYFINKNNFVSTIPCILPF